MQQNIAEDTAEDTVITKFEVKESARTSILPKYAGSYLNILEPLIYQVLSEYCAEYRGAYWQIWELSNHTFFMVPEVNTETLKMSCSGNFYSGEMSAEAAGIVACLGAFNRMAWATDDQRFVNHFYALKDFASQHSEATEIFKAID